MAQQTQQPPSRILVTGTVLFYLFAALAMVVANKWVLNSTDTPLFFLLAQLLIAVALFLLAHTVGLLNVPLKLDMVAVKGLGPMIALNVIGLSFSNYTLKYVDASFYQVARGLVLPFTVCTSWSVLHARPSLKLLGGCALVTLGFFVGVFLDGTSVSLLGIFFGVASSLITALHSVVIKKSLDVVGGSTIHLSWYTNLLSAFVLVPTLFFAGEMPGVAKLMLSPSGSTAVSTFVVGSIITGLLGFLMNLASLLSIKVTSPITHMVSSAVRGVAASLLGVWLFHDVITAGRASSIGIILLGSIYYTYVKQQESSAPPPSTHDIEYERAPLEDLESGLTKAGRDAKE